MADVDAKTRVSHPAQQKARRRTMLPFFLIVALLMAAAVFAFTLLYGGTGAKALLTDAPAKEETKEPPVNEPAPEDTEPVLQQEAVAGPLAAVVMQKKQENNTAPTGVQANTGGRMFPYLENGKWGYKDPSGVPVITPVFDGAMEFGKGLYAFAAVKDGNGQLRWGLITRMGAWQVQPQFSDVRGYAEDMAAVEKNQKWGYIDLSGKVVIDYTFREAGDFSCGRAAVRTGSYWGYTDTDGDLAVAATWDEAGTFCDDMAFVKQGAKQYIINKVGEKITTMGDITGTAYSEGFACVKYENGKYGYFNINRDRAFQQMYANAQNYSDGYAAVCENGLWGYITNRGVIAVPCVYRQAAPFNQSRAAVQDESGKWGYIDKAGVKIIECQYDEAEPFKLNYAIVKTGKDVGVVSRDGTYAYLYTA
ncbi:MAG: WG repeat-containing protein [Eubacteriales bacterium]|nr:WG repeat-containing protein [Eubacteriales bacterium]